MAHARELNTYPKLPANASIFTRLRLATVALRALAEDAGDPYYAPLLHACLDGQVFARLARSWREGDEGSALLDARTTLQGRELDLEALARLPDGTLGREFVRYFEVNGIEPFVSQYPVDSDVDYLSKRYRETHDLFHLVTGYGTDEEGEMELQAFVLGNLGLRQTVLILLFAVPRHFPGKSLAEIRAYLRRLYAAVLRGKRSRELLSVRYERLWEEPVAALADLLCAPAMI
ncbi:MAG: Coq4 family protein [Nannocystaceae bacterium]